MNVELFIANGLIVGVLYGVVAMCFVLIYKSTQVVNFAQGELLLLGAWVCWWLLTQFQLPFIWGFLVTLVFMFVFGILIQVVVLRPLIGEPIISVIMVTVGMSMFFQALIGWMFGQVTQRYPPVFTTETINIAGLAVQTPYLMSLVVSLVIMGLFWYFFTYTRTGLAMRATASDQQAAQSLGVSVKQVFALSWAISATVSAMAGIVFGLVNGVSGALSFIGIKVFPAVILGGLDSIVGGIVGGVIVGLVENLAEYVDGQYLHVGNLYTIVPFYVLIAILMFKPYGLFGTEDIERI
jgi:branched-chain amino acid transport system permease protein